MTIGGARWIPEEIEEATIRFENPLNKGQEEAFLRADLTPLRSQLPALLGEDAYGQMPEYSAALLAPDAEVIEEVQWLFRLPLCELHVQARASRGGFRGAGLR